MFLVKGVETKQPGDQDQGIKGDQCQDPGQKWKPGLVFGNGKKG